MDLSVIIPCKREAATISDCVLRVARNCPGAEIIVVDSGLDGTKDLVDQLKSSIPHLHYVLSSPDRGKGDAIRNGLQHATRGYIAQIDADLQFLPEEIPLLIAPLIDGRSDMTLGSRFMPGAKREAGSAPMARSLGNFVVSWWSSVLFNRKISDALAGMKAWRRAVTDSYRLTSHTYSYEIELFARALLKGWRIMDVPVSFEKRKEGQSTVPLIKTGFILLKDALAFRLSKSGIRT